jgi:RNA polymerase sigma-70 factor (ECF subfamily)
MDSTFPVTSWGRLRPGAGDPALEEAALAALAERYWRPIHAWIRAALGRRDDEARDLTQDFFAWVLETGFLRKADPARGRFRSFLKTALRHYVTDADRERRAQKRGGGRRFVPLGPTGDDDASAPEPADPRARTPDEQLDAAWRSELIRTALARLEEELRREGRERQFLVFRDYFLDPGEDTDYRSVAAAHGLSVTDVSNVLARVKERYRAHLKEAVRDTVDDPTELAGEIAWLLGGARA